MEFPKIDQLEVATYRVPTDSPESDGTLEWNHTDIVVVHLRAGRATGVGWTYASSAAAALIDDVLRDAIEGHSFDGTEAAWIRMTQRLRNVGAPGAGSMAVSAVDVALWDLHGRLLGVPLADLFGRVRKAVPAYGSGGFTSYTEAQLCEQLASWVDRGLSAVKMKVGREPSLDRSRVRVARAAIGDQADLFVDANGAYSTAQAAHFAQSFAEDSGVSWFEEPRPSRDLSGLTLLRARAPAGLDIAAGEYGDLLVYFKRMLDAGAVDCLQADVTRCGGYTGFRKVAALCEAAEIPLSAHCAPQLHAHVACASSPLRHVEYFHDHARIAGMFYDGALSLDHGALRPRTDVPGHGMTFKRADAEPFRI